MAEQLGIFPAPLGAPFPVLADDDSEPDAGVGIAVLPEVMYGAAMRTGRLSPVMPGWTLPAPQLFAVFISRQGMAPAVRAFIDYLVEVLDRGKLNPLECPERDQVRASQQPSVVT